MWRDARPVRGRSGPTRSCRRPSRLSSSSERAPGQDGQMGPCKAIRGNMRDVAALPLDRLPPEVQGHLASCQDCARALAAARLARGLMAAAAEAPEPPAGFAERILATLPAHLPRGRIIPELWRPAWGLVPAFAAMAVALLIVFQTSTAPPTTGLLPLEDLSPSEQLVLGVPAPDHDLVLTAVITGGGH